MWYTDNEIIKAYKNAEDKKDIITILSELNSCSKQKIIDILRFHHIIDEQNEEVVNNGGIDMKTHNRVDWNDTNIAKLRQRVNDGKTNRQICAEFDISMATVGNVLRRFDITRRVRNTPGPAPKPKVNQHLSEITSVSIDTSDVNDSVLSEISNVKSEPIFELKTDANEIDRLKKLNDKYNGLILKTLNELEIYKNLLDKIASQLLNSNPSYFKVGMQVGQMTTKVESFYNDVDLLKAEFELEKD